MTGVTVECPECDGQGYHDIRQFGRHVEDEYLSVPCRWCDGTGTARAAVPAIPVEGRRGGLLVSRRLTDNAWVRLLGPVVLVALLLAVWR